MRKATAARGLFAVLTLAASLVLVAPLVLAAPLAAQTSADTGQSPLAPGDIVRLRFVQEPELSGDFPVDEMGRVSLPLLGFRDVTRYPADYLKRQLVADYARQLRDQPAQVTLLRRVRVLGAVRTPGLYHVDPTMTLGDAIALAGGVLPTGKLESIQIYRDGRVRRTDVSTRMPVIALLSGDQIYVPEKSWFMRNPSILLGAVISAITIIATRR